MKGRSKQRRKSHRVESAFSGLATHSPGEPQSQSVPAYSRNRSQSGGRQNSIFHKRYVKIGIFERPHIRITQKKVSVMCVDFLWNFRGFCQLLRDLSVNGQTNRYLARKLHLAVSKLLCILPVPRFSNHTLSLTRPTRDPQSNKIHLKEMVSKCYLRALVISRKGQHAALRCCRSSCC